jgi:hypothetical protein
MAAPAAGPDRLPLTQADYDAFARCGISRETAEAAGIFRVDSAEGARIVGRRAGSGDYRGLVFPYFLPGEKGPREYRLRLDNPPFEMAPDGTRKPKGKYLSPPGARPMLYFLPQCSPEWLRDATLPLLITEGEKKTLALHDLGWHALGDAAERPRWLAIGLAGVWNWRGTVGRELTPDGSHAPVKGAIKDLDLISSKGRRVVIVFDQNVRSNPHVQAARWELTRELRRRGARVSWFHWPRGVPEGVNGIDDAIGALGRDRVLELLTSDGAVREAPERLQDAPHDFEVLGFDHYRLSIPSAGIVIDLDRLRWEGGDLHCEAIIRCDLPGVKTYNGILAAGKLNLSSLTSRRSFAKELQTRTKSDEIVWSELLEEAALRSIDQERSGAEVKLLDDYPDAEEEEQWLHVHGLPLLAELANVIYAPGGTGKSYFGLWLSCELAAQGRRVLYIDTEAGWKAHRIRKRRLYGHDRHPVYYYRARRPITEEADAIRRTVEQHRIQFLILDSISLSAGTPLEDSSTANAVFGALNRIGVGDGLGALLFGHCPKGRDDLFGSVFWENNARLIWHAMRVEDDGDSYVLKMQVKKANYSRHAQVVCFRICHHDGERRTEIFPVDPLDVQEAAESLPLADRIEALVRTRPLTKDEIADALEESPETVGRVVRRWTTKGRFTVLAGGRVAVREKERRP